MVTGPIGPIGTNANNQGGPPPPPPSPPIPPSGGGTFWGSIRYGWEKFSKARSKFRKWKIEDLDVPQVDNLVAQTRVDRAKIVSEKTKAQLDQVRDTRAKAGYQRVQRATDLFIKAGTMGGAPTKESMAIYDSPALREMTYTNILSDKSRRQNVADLREAANLTKKDLKQYTAGTQSMRGLNNPAYVPAKDALLVSGKLKSVNAPPTGMRGLNAPEALPVAAPDFTVARQESKLSVNRLRAVTNPRTLSVTPIAQKQTQAPPTKLAILTSADMSVITPQKLFRLDVERGSSPISKITTERGLKVEPKPLALPSPRLFKLKKGFDNSYYKRNLSKFKRELR